MAISTEYESEERKRKLAAAQDYLDKRDAFLATTKPGYTVDMTGEDTSKMSDEQIKVEGNRRIAEAKTNFQNSFSVARKEGFGSDPTLATKAYLSSARSPRIMEDIGNGAKADTATANRIALNRERQNIPAESPKPDWQRGRAAMEEMRIAAKARDEESKARSALFFGRLEQEKSLKRQATQDMALANRERSNARLVEKATRAGLQRYLATGGREGNLVTADQMDAATKRVARSEMGLGTTNNVDDKYKTFYARAERGARYNPYEPTQVAESVGRNDPRGSKNQVESEPTPTAPPTTSNLNQNKNRTGSRNKNRIRVAG